MNIKNDLTNKLKKIFKKLEMDENYALVTFSDRPDIAHFQCNGAFAIAKSMGLNPRIIAENIVANCEDLKNNFEITIAGAGFINFKLNNKYISKIANQLASDSRCGVDLIDNPLNVVLDYGGANVAKPLHVGHMRSAIIGEALKRLHVFKGNKAISDVHLGDWGLQMGLTIAQLMDDYDMGYYFGENKTKIDITIEMLEVAYPKASLRKKEDVDFYNKASDITLWLQNKKKGYYDLWLEIRKVSVEMAKRTYQRLGVDFDLWNGESSVNDIVPKVVNIFKKKDLLYESDGALVVNVEDRRDNSPMPPTIIQKHNGAQMYAITDIATIFERQLKYKPDIMLYLTDNRQILHFKQVFRCSRLGELIPENCQLNHITFGTVNGKDGKPFKTRDGGTMHLDDLIDMVSEKALSKLTESKMASADISLAQEIGVGALIFGDLSNVISKDYVFDIDKFINFEGKTGPYLQYSAVRIKSLLQKADINIDIAQIEIDEKTENIVLSLLKLTDSYDVCYKDNSLNALCLALYELCSSYSTFYNDVKILSELNKNLKLSYLKLSKLVYDAISLGLGVLNISIPDKM